MIADSLEKGAFILSLDTELAWGSAHAGKYIQRRELFEKTRPCINGLLDLLGKYRIRATWAIIGHLFLESCRPVNGVSHPEIIRPEYPWFSGDWFGPDPCAGLDTEPHWYGSDIVRKILDCRVSQEIGCHTFSHVRVGDPGCSRACFDSELKACQRIADGFGLKLRSFVFPWNDEGHLDVLRANGFIAYRGYLPPQVLRLPPLVRGAVYRLSAGMTTLPEKKMGVWNLPGCMFYPVYKGLTWSGALAIQVARAKRALRKAAQRSRIFHLWFHPFNLAPSPAVLLGGLEEIFAEVVRLREAGRLEDMTMGEMAETLERPAGQPAEAVATGPARVGPD